MKARNRLWVGLCASMLVHAGPAFASIPDPRNCKFTPVLVGSSHGFSYATADPFDVAGFQVWVRDINNAPLFAQVVEVDFSATTGVQLYTTTPGFTVDCAARIVRGTTDHDGYVRFGIQVGGSDPANHVVVRATTIFLGAVPVRSTDIDGIGARTDTNDLNIFRTALLSGAQIPELDFDISGTTDVSDFNLLRMDLFSGTIGTYCP